MPSGTSTTRARTHPARIPATTEVVWASGRCSTTSPALLSARVSSRSRAQATQPSAVHASQTSGGASGSTPMPSTWQPSRSATAHDGAASDRPNITVSSGCGTSEKHRTHGPPSSSSVWSAPAPRASTVRRPTSVVGTTDSGRTVPNTTGSASGVRRVATSVPAGTCTTSRWGADSQNVTGTRAAVAGNSRTPISSRNFR